MPFYFFGGFGVERHFESPITPLPPPRWPGTSQSSVRLPDGWWVGIESLLCKRELDSRHFGAIYEGHRRGAAIYKNR